LWDRCQPEGAMPVTAKLSRKFYEQFGDDITNELVEWFNAVDATYRADLRELNELNFARFDAKLEQRLGQLDAKWYSRWVELNSKIAETKANLESTLRQEIDAVRDRMRRMESRLVRWMLGFWTGAVIAIVGALVALRQFGI